MTVGSSHGRWNPLTWANRDCSRKDHTQPIAHTAAVASSANRSGIAAAKRRHRPTDVGAPGPVTRGLVSGVHSWDGLCVPSAAMGSSVLSRPCDSPVQARRGGGGRRAVRVTAELQHARRKVILGTLV